MTTAPRLFGQALITTTKENQMKTPRRLVALTAAVAVTSLALTACGRDDDDNGGGDTAGVTSDPCPDAVNEDNGCIYIGMISDFTGPFAPIGGPMVEGSQAFWQAVNEAGGIGGYDVDISTYVKDNTYNETTHAQVYNEIKDDILMLGHSMGTAHTNGILEDALNANMVVLPASLGSNWILEDGVMHIGTSYCAEAMNAVDYAVDELGAKSIGVVHFPGDYGDDAAVGARIAAEARGVKFFDYTTGPGGPDEQTSVISGLMKDKPDVVVMATSAIEVGGIVGTVAAQGFKGMFIGSIPAWSGALLQNEQLAPALEAMFLHISSIPAWSAETPGHEEMRAAAEAAGKQPNDWFAVGWAGSHAVKALLEKAIEDDKLSREGVMETLNAMTGVDSMGMLPEGDGHYAGEPNENAIRASFINGVDPKSPTGVTQKVDWFTGPTAESYEFTEACYLQK